MWNLLLMNIRNRLQRFASFIAVLIAVIIVSGCTSINLAGYDQQAYENATSMKAEVGAMMRKIGPTCAMDQADVDAVSLKLESAYEYANGVEYNNEAALNWRDQIDNLIGGVFETCQNQGAISQFAFDDLLIQVNEGFDTIICLEANKREITRCENLR